ncbi:hypothetical protein CAEBREN_11890 [Caenorhabditis brenneri]|uniref:Serpentine Receptor, class BC (Class B-like) n=1 Tax=Caenorhabditis brenneri TaxID=135651 RepID=G0NEF2_CAEBE|nr:hypothetical protein CAEBREN_11890 [Caenorhabditis brenneri]
MNITVVTVASSAFIFSISSFFLNTYLLLSVFWMKTVQRKPGMALIYFRFAVDSAYGFITAINLLYLLIQIFYPDMTVKNLSFFLAWPVFNIGTVRGYLVFFITLDRVLAACSPVFYFKHRVKLSNLIVLPITVSYNIFEYFILLDICEFVVDLPLNCMFLGCSVGQCYSSYWLKFEQVGYLLIGSLSLVLCSRLFIWNNVSKSTKNKEISRVATYFWAMITPNFQATRFALLDASIIFIFDVIPAVLMSKIPMMNFQSVGPFSAMCKHLGFLIEAFIIYKVLLSEKPVMAVSVKSMNTG